MREATDEATAGPRATPKDALQEVLRAGAQEMLARDIQEEVSASWFAMAATSLGRSIPSLVTSTCASHASTMAWPLRKEVDSHAVELERGPWTARNLLQRQDSKPVS